MRCLFNGKRVASGFLLFVFFFLFASVSAEAISNQLHVNIQVVDESGEIANGTYVFTFNITTDSSCTNVVYSNITTMNTDSRGIISYYLENVNLNFSEQYWLCYYRNGTLINNSKMGMVPYAFRAKNITSSGIQWDANTNLGNYNLTVNGSTFFVNTNLGRVGIGTTSPSTTLDVNGVINASQILINGTPISAGGITWANAINGTLMLQETFDTNYTANDPVYRSWTLNYSDYLIAKEYALNDSLWTLNYSDYLNTKTSATNWDSNYSLSIELFRAHLTWENVTNGTLLLTEDFNTNYTANDPVYRSWSLNYSDYLIIRNYALNDSLWTLNYSNFSTIYGYALNSSSSWNTNYSDYLITKNYALNNSLWTLNYSDYLITKNYALNDSLWTLNYSEFLTHVNWSTVMNGTLATQAAIIAANTSMAYYVNTTVNNSMKAYVDASFLRKDGDNGTGTYNFNGGWTLGGATISGGDLYAQTIYVYNITSLAVNNLAINGSMLPQQGYDNTFDVGNGTLRWRHGNFSGNISASWFLGNINASYIQNAPWLTEATETDPKWGANYSDYLNTKNYALNNSLWTLNYSDYLTTKNYALNDSLWSLNYSNFSTVYGYALNSSGSITWATAYNGTLAKTDAANSFGNFNQSFNGTTLFIDATNGRVGIGTTAPVGKLDVGSGNEFSFQNNSNNSGYYGIRLKYGVANAFSIFHDDSANTLNFGFNATANNMIDTHTKLMVINSAGNVSIGTTSPNQKLTVNGSVNISATASNPYLYFGKGGYMYDNGTSLILGHA